MEYTYIAPHGAGWLKAAPSAIGEGLWIKTNMTGVILPDDEIPRLIAKLQAYMSKKARERAENFRAARNMASGMGAI